MLTSEQRRALVEWKTLLAQTGMEPGHDLAARVPGEILLTVEELGLVNRIGDRIEPSYRLVSHLGLWLFCENVSPSAMFYYGNDSAELSRVLEGAEGAVLDLCSGVGTQALVCARTATRVTAVEIEPLAAKLFWVNAAMNGLSDKVELLNGDLLDPVAGRKFDVISCNPPFMPVAPGVRYPRFADGGGDGLEVVRRLAAGLPEALAPGGRCEVIGAVLGNGAGPDLAAFHKMATDSRLAITIDCRTCEELEGKTMRQLVGTALNGGSEDVEEAFRSHFASLQATHLYCFLLHAVRAPSPMVCASYHGGQSTAVWI
jgi:methylase of polypeptide subunit release factors